MPSVRLPDDLLTCRQVNFMARLAAACGCSLYILTNSAGGAIPGMVPGSAMVIRDHIRWTFVDPLRDVHDHRLCPPGYSPVGPLLAPIGMDRVAEQRAGRVIQRETGEAGWRERRASWANVVQRDVLLDVWAHVRNACRSSRWHANGRRSIRDEVCVL